MRRCIQWKSGQAMVEFLLGLMGIMFLLVGLLQIREISVRSLQLNLNIREALADQLNAGGLESAGTFAYSEGHAVGNDDKVYTADDVLLSGSPGDFFPEFLEAVGYSENGSQPGVSMSEYFEQYSRPGSSTHRSDTFENLELDQLDLANALDMQYASETEDIEIMPFLRSILGKSYFTVDRGIWMPGLTGLMEKDE